MSMIRPLPPGDFGSRYSTPPGDVESCTCLTSGDSCNKYCSRNSPVGKASGTCIDSDFQNRRAADAEKMKEENEAERRRVDAMPDGSEKDEMMTKLAVVEANAERRAAEAETMKDPEQCCYCTSFKPLNSSEVYKECSVANGATTVNITVEIPADHHNNGYPWIPGSGFSFNRPVMSIRMVGDSPSYTLGPELKMQLSDEYNVFQDTITFVDVKVVVTAMHVTLASAGTACVQNCGTAPGGDANDTKPVYAAWDRPYGVEGVSLHAPIVRFKVHAPCPNPYLLDTHHQTHPPDARHLITPHVSTHLSFAPVTWVALR